VQDATRYALCDALAAYDPLVEVGIGYRSDVAAGLVARGHAVTATDVEARPVPEGVRFVRDDVTDPEPEIYAGAAAIYALNCPPELHRPIRDLARSVGAAFPFTTLGTDPPAVPVETRTLPEETLYLATAEPG
jgi:uncharacterized protein